jgi:hypothetical protein
MLLKVAVKYDVFVLKANFEEFSIYIDFTNSVEFNVLLYKRIMENSFLPRIC